MNNLKDQKKNMGRLSQSSYWMKKKKTSKYRTLIPFGTEILCKIQWMF